MGTYACFLKLVVLLCSLPKSLKSGEVC